MDIKRMVFGSLETNAYVVSDEQSKTAVVIDPGAEAESIVKYIKSHALTLKAILLTHGHFDHVGAAEALKEHFDVPVIAHKEEAKLMEDPIKNLSKYMLGDDIIAHADTYIEEDEVIDFGNGLAFKGILVPGHSPKSICFYNQEAKIVFSGDTLMAGSIGRTDLYDGHPDDLLKMITKNLLCLPEETVVYPGHGNETTIGHELRYNQFLY